MTKRASAAAASTIIPHPARPPTDCDFNPQRPMKPKTMREAVQVASGAAVKRATGEAMIAEDGDHTVERFNLAEADSMDAMAAEFMDIGNHVTGPHSIGNGGELIVRDWPATSTNRIRCHTMPVPGYGQSFRSDGPCRKYDAGLVRFLTTQSAEGVRPDLRRAKCNSLYCLALVGMSVRDCFPAPPWPTAPSPWLSTGPRLGVSDRR
jgi:hypothetical protein